MHICCSTADVHRQGRHEQEKISLRPPTPFPKPTTSPFQKQQMTYHFDQRPKPKTIPITQNEVDLKRAPGKKETARTQRHRRNVNQTLLFTQRPSATGEEKTRIGDGQPSKQKGNSDFTQHRSVSLDIHKFLISTRRSERSYPGRITSPPACI